MVRIIVAFVKNVSGAIAPLAAVMIPLLFSVTAVGVDASMWMRNNRDMQSAADSAAIAGAWEVVYGMGEDEAQSAGLKEAVNNGYQDVAGNSLALSFGEDDDGNETVTANLVSADHKYFANLVYDGDVFNTVSAATAVILPNDDYCMLSLAPNGTTMVFDGGITINSVGCGLAVNSNDPNAALNVNGNSSTINVGDVSVVGGIDDAHDQINATSKTEGAPPASDPYEDLDTPPYTTCTQAEQNAGPVQVDSVADLPAADANGVRVLCGGLLIKNGKTVDFPAGVYVIDGGDMNVRGTLTGTGVSFVLTNSGGGSYGSYGDVKFSGDVDIHAPLPEDGLADDVSQYVGVAIYQDRDAPSQVQCNDMQGNSQVLVDGATYLPARCLDIGGGSTAAATNTCSRVIAQTIKIHGNPKIANSCEGKGVEDIQGGQPQVKLIL